MATGNEILGYTGNQNLAFGSTALPATSTDQVVDTSPSIDYWNRYYQLKLQQSEAEKARLAQERLKTAAELQKKLDIGEYEIIPQDFPEFTKLWGKLRETLKKPGAAAGYLSGDPSNPYFNDVRNQLDIIEKFSQFSTQQGADANVAKKEVYQDPRKYKNAQDIDNYLSIGDPFKRANETLNLEAARKGFDATPYQKSLLEVLQNDNTNLKGESDQFNNVVYTVDGELNLDGVRSNARATFDNNPDAQELGYFLIQQDQNYYGTDPKGAFEKWSVDLLPDSLQPQIRGINFSPTQRAEATKVDVPFEDVFTFNVADTAGVSAKKADLQKQINELDKKPNKTEAENQRLIQLKDQLEKTSGKVKTVYGVGGGWDVSKTSENPRGINLNVTEAHLTSEPSKGGQILTKNQIGANAWTVDVLGRTNVYKLPNGRYLYTASPDERHDLPTEDVVIINSTGAGLFDTPQNFLIPYRDIATQLQNSKIEFERRGGSESAPKTSPQKTITLSEIKRLYGKDLKGYTDQQIIDAYSEQGYIVK